MTNAENFKNWCNQIALGQCLDCICTAESAAEVLQMLELATTANKWFNRNGHQCGQRGSNNVVTEGFTTTCKVGNNVNKFEVKPPSKAKAKRKQEVTATSLNAYHSIDFSTLCGKVAQIIFDVTKSGKDITRKELEVLYNIPQSSVCGRVNELLKESEEMPHLINGRYYRLVTTSARLSNCNGASKVVNEGLKCVEVQGGGAVAQGRLF